MSSCETPNERSSQSPCHSRGILVTDELVANEQDVFVCENIKDIQGNPMETHTYRRGRS